MNLHSHLLQPCEEKPHFRLHRTRMTQSAWLQTPNGRSTGKRIFWTLAASRGLHGLLQHPGSRLHRPGPFEFQDLKIHRPGRSRHQKMVWCGCMWIDSGGEASYLLRKPSISHIHQVSPLFSCWNLEHPASRKPLDPPMTLPQYGGYRKHPKVFWMFITLLPFLGTYNHRIIIIS